VRAQRRRACLLLRVDDQRQARQRHLGREHPRHTRARGGLGGRHRHLAGFDHACAIRQGGQVVCWGNNLRGQLGTGATGGIFATPTPSLVTDAIDIYAGFEFTCALRPSTSGGNRVTCWGENDEGELGRGFTSTSEVSTEVDVVGVPSDVIQLGQSAAGAFTCVRSSGGAVYCWGFSSLNAVGQGSNSTVAIRISDGSGPIADAVKVIPGVDSACVLRPGDGPGRFAVWCWGGGRIQGQSRVRHGLAGGGARPRRHGAHHGRARRRGGSAVGLRHTQRRRGVVLGTRHQWGAGQRLVRHGGSAPRAAGDDAVSPPTREHGAAR
jgi:hypothetical protein